MKLYEINDMIELILIDLDNEVDQETGEIGANFEEIENLLGRKFFQILISEKNQILSRF